MWAEIHALTLVVKCRVCCGADVLKENSYLLLNVFLSKLAFSLAQEHCQMPVT